VELFDPRQEWRGGLDLQRAFPDAQGLTGVAGFEVGVAKEERRRQEVPPDARAS
jgi:hypothetical protein